MKPLVHFDVLAIIVLLALAGAVPSPGPAMPLDSLVQQALRQAPELPGMTAGVDAARARVTPAAALPDPLLGVGAQAMGLPPGDPSTLTLEFSQELPFPGKRGARRATAEAVVAELEAARMQSRAEVVQQVRTLYASLHALDRRAQVLAGAVTRIEAAVQTVSARLAAGQAAPEDLLRLQLQASRVRQSTAGLKADRAGTAAELNLLLGEAPDHPIDGISGLPDVSLPSLDSLAGGLESAPELQALRAGVLAARCRLEEARLEGRPDFMIGAGGGTTAWPEPVVMLRLGMSVPAWKHSKQDRLLEAATHDLAEAEAALAAGRARLSTELTGLVARWHGTQEVLNEFRTAILPQSRTALNSALSAYSAGRGDFSLVVEDLNLLLEAGAEAAQAEADGLGLWARIEALGPRAEGVQTSGDTP